MKNKSWKPPIKTRPVPGKSLPVFPPKITAPVSPGKGRITPLPNPQPKTPKPKTPKLKTPIKKQPHYFTEKTPTKTPVKTATPLRKVLPTQNKALTWYK